MELCQQLSNSQDITDLLYLSGADVSDTLELKGSQSTARSAVARIIVHSPAIVGLYQKISSLRATRALDRFPDYVYHGTSFRLPKCVGPKVVTIHDLSPYKFPECHPQGRVAGLQAEIQNSIATADAIITASEFTRQELATYFGHSLDTIHAIPLAANHTFHPRAVPEVEPVLNAFGVRFQSYSLFVGTIEPRKNLDVLLAAYEALPSVLRDRWPLVVVGYKGWKSDVTRKKIELGVAKGWVKYLGFVDENRLPLLYAGAKLFIFPSRYEGFGLPVLEAMASGVPVVCSTSSSLPEVASGCALLFDAGDVSSLVTQISRALDDVHWRLAASTNGLYRAKEMTWVECARKTIEVYESVLRKS